jgi:hypothetical protein
MSQARPHSPPPCGEGLGVGVKCRGNAHGEIAVKRRATTDCFPPVAHPTRLGAREARLATVPVKGRVIPSRLWGGSRLLDSEG